MSRRLRPYTKLTQPPLGPAPARRRREVLLAALDLGVFVLAMSEFVRLLLPGPTDGKAGGFFDALAATVALVMPTPYGDVPLEGTGGHLLSVVIIVGGLSLALRLGRACLRGGGKVHASCPGCGRRHHDRDAAHCTACGRRLLDIPDGHR